MKWILPNKKTINVPVGKYTIDWNKPAASKEAQQVQNFLKKHCFTHHILAEFMIPRTRLRIDYLDLTNKTAWEHQGAQHNELNLWWHRHRLGLLNSIKRDDKKRDLIELNGFTLIETVKDDFPLTREWVTDMYGVYL